MYLCTLVPFLLALDSDLDLDLAFSRPLYFNHHPPSPACLVVPCYTPHTSNNKTRLSFLFSLYPQLSHRQFSRDDRTLTQLSIVDPRVLESILPNLAIPRGLSQWLVERTLLQPAWPASPASLLLKRPLAMSERASVYNSPRNLSSTSLPWNPPPHNTSSCSSRRCSGPLLPHPRRRR